MMKIVCLVGTRPECIKMAPVIQKFRERTNVNVTIVGTGQHRELSAQTLKIFDISPDISLDVMTSNQSLGSLTSRIMEKLEFVWDSEKPDLVLAQGDTTSVMAAALSAFYRRIPFGHIEAGLRTHDLRNPFPEELNRIIAGRIADIHFAPTEQARRNLLKEGARESSIYVTGNTVVDALLSVAEKKPPCEFPRKSGNDLALVTVHRRENFGSPLIRICSALREVHEKYQRLEFVLPLHPNPAVREVVLPILGDLNRFHIISPVDYVTMVGLMQSSKFVLTDSGGVQEEAPALGKPVLVVREETERPEAIHAGVAKLIGTQTANIVAEIASIYENRDIYDQMSRSISPYGDGLASERIVEACVSLFAD